MGIDRLLAQCHGTQPTNREFIMGGVSVLVRGLDGCNNDLVQQSDACVSPSCVTYNTSTQDCSARCEGGPDCTCAAASRVVAVCVYTTDSKLWEI
jgi:hypothetical protein